VEGDHHDLRAPIRGRTPPHRLDVRALAYRRAVGLLEEPFWKSAASIDIDNEVMAWREGA
jgi:hypothetical protein